MSTTSTLRRRPAPPRAAGQHGYGAEILIASFAALLLEISYTRIISYKLFYYYTFLVVGLSLLGIGTGGTLVAISGRLRRAPLEKVVMWSLLLGGVSVGIGFLVVSLTTTNLFALWDYGTIASLGALGRLLLICLMLFGSFVAVGILLSSLFAHRPEQISRLYFADLLGAGLACAVVVFLLRSIGPSSTVLLAGLLMVLTALRLAVRSRSRALVPGIVVAVLLAAGALSPNALPELRTDFMKSLYRGDPIFTDWSPLFRVDVAPFGDGRRVVMHDGLLSSVITEFNGDVATLDRFEQDDRAVPFAPFDGPIDRSLIIGAAGGHEILASLHFGVGQIDGVEIDPVTYSLVTDKMADYAGNLADRPDVNYVNADGRSFLARSDDRYDLIWYPAPDSYAAANAATSSAFVMSESYLYTTEMIKESLEHLAPGGILADQDGEIDFRDRPNRTLRYIAAARDALSDLGVDDPSQHIIVASTSGTEAGRPLPTILVKREPFTQAEIDRVIARLPSFPSGELHYVPGAANPPGPVSELITLQANEVDEWIDAYPFDVDPATDDSPFYYHFVAFDDVARDFTDPIDARDFESGVGERVLLLLLGVSIAFAAVFLLLPFVAIRDEWSALPRKRQSALYFASLGLGFMFFEVTLIQRLVLFLGFPTYSLTVTLASILIFTGIGALLSGRLGADRQRALPPIAGVLVVLTLFYAFALPEVTEALLHWPLGLRVVFTFIVLAPLGLCLGMFMPMGVGAVARLTDHRDEYVAWGWAVNGFASVVGVALSTILAMTFGFKAVMFIALAIYLLAIAVLRSLLRAPAFLDAPAATPSPQSSQSSSKPRYRARVGGVTQ